MLYKNISFSKFNLKKILNIKKIEINNVGINNLYYPIIFDDNTGKLQKTIGLWNFGILIKKYKRGVHMSRFFKILEKITNKPINVKSFYFINKLIVKELESNDIFFQVSFLYFIKKKSPISNYSSLMNYKLTLLIKKKNILIDYILKILVPVNTLCPCSKDISFYNAHNQRSFIIIFLKIKRNIDILEIIKSIEKQSSSEIWSFLKRNDEKFITEFSYKNPKFVEDLIRNISETINNMKNIISYIVKVENLESIHSHNAYAILKKIKKPKYE